MAGNRIKGITIEIGGDTTDLQKSLKAVDSSIRNTQTALKDVNKLLKLDPKNTELLRQKQELLKTSITDTKDRLKVLKDAYKNLDGKATDEAKEQQKALSREIIETEQKLKSLKGEYNDFGSVAKQKLQSVGDDLKNIGSNVSDVGKGFTVGLTAPLVALGTIGVSYNAQMEQYRTMFTTLTGSAEEADRVISQLQADAQKSPFDTASLVEANQYLISAGVEADAARQDILNLGNAIAATGGGSAELSRMAQNLQQIKNVGKATSQDIKQFANAGINIYGLLADATGKTTEQVKDMDVSYELLSEALAKASAEGGKYYGAMEAQSETFNGSLASTKESIQQLLGSITESAMPIIAKVLKFIKDMIDRFNALDGRVKKIILIVAAVAAAIGPVITIIGGIISGLGTLMTVISTLFSPIGAVIAAVAAVIAIGVLLYKNWDTIKAKLKQFVDRWKKDWGDVKAFFNKIWDNLVQGAKDKVGKIVDAIKGMVQKAKDLINFKWELPKLKLPHLSWSSEPLDPASLKYKILDALGLPTSVPKLSVEWYRKAMENGMILNGATIFGAKNGRLLGGGEAGSEAIVGTNSLYNMIQQAVGTNGMTVNMTVNGSGVSANELANIVIDKLTNQIVRNNQRW